MRKPATVVTPSAAKTRPLSFRAALRFRSRVMSAVAEMLSNRAWQKPLSAGGFAWILTVPATAIVL